MPGPRTRSGFTLIELLVVIAVVAILAGILMPSLSRAKQAAQSVACLNNLNQLQLGMLQYTVDHDDFYPSNNFVYLPFDGAYVLSESWAPGNPKTDIDTRGIKAGSIYPYVGNTDVYRCPADRKMVVSNGVSYAHTRSYMLSIWINCVTEPSGLVRSTEGKSPLSDIFAFICAHEDSIADAAFGIYHPSKRFVGNNWIDLPTDRHRRGGNLTFLDGHIEHWRWQAPKRFRNYGQLSKGDDLTDLRRLQAALPQPIKR